VLFRNFEILNLFLHLTLHIFLFFFLLYLFLFAINLDITPDLRAEFALHPMSKLIKPNVFFGDLRSDELNSDVDSLSDLDSVTYWLFFFSEVCSVDKDQARVLWPREFSFVDKSPSLLENFARLEILSFAKTLCNQLWLVFLLNSDFLSSRLRLFIFNDLDWLNLCCWLDYYLFRWLKGRELSNLW
jgi:hypothetical protein